MARRLSILRSLVALTAFSLAGSATAQGPWHYLNKGDMPPGVIGLRQLERGGPLAGYFQPVEITAPQGTLISLAADGGFADPQTTRATAGMLIGHVYRLKVSNIKFFEDHEVFPTIEVIDRLYPPPGQAMRFPIPIELTAEELRFALEGRYVTRVIYVEEPRTALPVQGVPGKQQYLEIAPGEDVMETADKLGRPVAILRMGSRTPVADETDNRFLYENPPIYLFEKPQAPLARNSGLEDPLEAPPQLGRPSHNFPRLPETKLR